ncbi:AraC-like transcriptional regulator QhpR [Acidocella sp.]|uniref:AraC-like transcriptional regulator QhpR n=1 Tax=Acidocella sp. TaxID=50710 RepID=UPI003D02C358
MGIEPSISAAAAVGVSGVIGQCGGDAERILGAARLRMGEVENPGCRINLGHYCGLFELAARQTGADDFGLRYGLQYRVENMGALGALILASPSLGAALRNLCAYFPALQEHSAVTLRGQGGLMALEYRITDGRIAQRRQDAELSLAIFMGIFRRCLGPGWAPLEMQFEHLRAVEAEAVAGAFNCPVYYAAPRNAFIFHRAVLSMPMPGADPARLPALEEALRRQASSAVPEDFLGQVLSLIRTGFTSGEANIDIVASRLGYSRAGLYRRLALEGADFSELTQRIRRELAESYASLPGIAFTDVALLLGYSELSAFSRAFTRWTGLSPARYRQVCQPLHA